MDLVTRIVWALAAGADTSLKSTATDAIKDAYRGLKELIESRYRAWSVDVLDVLESDPRSEVKQRFVLNFLADTNISQDHEALELARRVLALVKEQAPETGRAIGLHVDRIEAGGITIEDVSSTPSGVGVRDKDSSIGPDISVQDIKAGRETIESKDRPRDGASGQQQKGDGRRLRHEQRQKPEARRGRSGKSRKEEASRSRQGAIRDKQKQREEQQQQQQMAVPPGPVILRRTPHLDLDQMGPAAPEKTIRVRVFADKAAARSGEESEDIVIELLPHLRRIVLETHLLVSPQLEVVGSAVQPLTIKVNKDTSLDASFEIRIRTRDEIAALMRDLPSVKRASVSAVFNYQGRPSGSVSRIVPLDLDFMVPPDSPNVKERIPSGTLRIEPEAKRADLLVQVRAQPINDGRQFQCWVSTPLIEAEEEERWEDWNLPAVAESIVRGYMENFVDEEATPLERLSSLKGAGRQLFDAAPTNFKSVYWKLADAGRAPKTIAIVSDEPYIPWELMIPHRRQQGRSESSDPLGVTCAVGRWVLGDGSSGPQHLPLSDSIVIAPRYTGKNALPYAEEEAQYVLEHFPGVRIEPARLETIDETLASQRGSILHLCCHGVDLADGAAQSVYLEGDRKFDTTMLSGLDNARKALEEQVTLVVINACEVGRPKPALVGLGGFAQTFIDLGAAGVVAALWSVRDDLAHEIAMEFYQKVLEDPGRPFAEILRGVRARAYDKGTGAEDTYAAYCFYGDPLACAAP